VSRPPLLPVIIGTGFGSGFWPWGPGTAGSVVAVAVWLLLHSLLEANVLTAVTVVLIVVMTVAGTWATARLMPFWGDDPQRVVADEMAGTWVALLPAGCCNVSLLPSAWSVTQNVWLTAAAALLLFRLFDIAKPLGIRSLDRRRGAFWVMADDLLAGAYAAIILLII